MNAATLMNSGTVTKKPAMKLRRSHCIGMTVTGGGAVRPRRVAQPDDRHGREREAIAGEDVERMRRQIAEEEPDRHVADDGRGDHADDEERAVARA